MPEVGLGGFLELGGSSPQSARREGTQWRVSASANSLQRVPASGPKKYLDGRQTANGVQCKHWWSSKTFQNKTVHRSFSSESFLTWLCPSH